MAAPTSTDVYTELEGYGITTDVISPAWITAKINNIVIPFIEKTCRQTFQAETTYDEYYDGLGTSVLVLRRRPVNSVVAVYVVGAIINDSFNITNIELDTAGGSLKVKSSEDNYLSTTVFPRGIKNLRVIYKAGFAAMPDDIKQAVIFFACELALGNIANRTGGGNLSTQGFSRQFGNRGKYSSARNDFKRLAMDILKRYSTGIA